LLNTDELVAALNEEIARLEGESNALCVPLGGWATDYLWLGDLPKTARHFSLICFSTSAMAIMHELSEVQWNRIRDFLPGRKEHVGRRAMVLCTPFCAASQFLTSRATCGAAGGSSKWQSSGYTDCGRRPYGG
jgi:hypothetical protein